MAFPPHSTVLVDLRLTDGQDRCHGATFFCSWDSPGNVSHALGAEIWSSLFSERLMTLYQSLALTVLGMSDAAFFIL